jgi:hypothetical protein
MLSLLSQWTDDELEGLLKTLVIGIIIAGIGYYLFSPTRQAVVPPQNNQQQNQRVPAQRLPQQPNRPQQTVSSAEDEEGIDHFLKSLARVPPHHIKSSSTSRVVAHDGIVPFRFTKAATVEAKQAQASSSLNDTTGTTDEMFLNRKDRARILAKLFKKLDPPAKGNMLILSIPSSQIGNTNGNTNANAKLRRILYLLGTYYNLFIMVNCDNDPEYKDQKELNHNDYEKDKERYDSLIAKLYDSSESGTESGTEIGIGIGSGIGSGQILTEEVLPSHRIVVTTSVASRVAFVRSFPKAPDYIVGSDSDCHLEEEMQTLLTKFGYRVTLKNLETLLSQ